MNVAVQPLRALDGTQLSAALRSGIHRLISREEVINKINVFPVPDGDTGTNLALTAQAVLATLRANPETHAGQLLTRIADAALDGARGNSGAILAQFLQGVGETVAERRHLRTRDLACAAPASSMLAPGASSSCSRACTTTCSAAAARCSPT